MLFNSLQFLIFFPVVLLVYYVLPSKVKQYWLLVASYYFYMCWNAKYALLIFASTVITFLSGILMEKIKQKDLDEKKKVTLKKWVVAGSFLINLGILFFFKYFNFTVDLLTSIFAAMHVELNIPAFDVILPVGISFYTFQALSYTMDVYRDEIYAEKNFFRYALFVSFFPQLVAGPIERSKNLLKQLAVPKKFDAKKAKEGILLMLWGYFLKLVIADRAAIFVNTVYGKYAEYGGSMLVLASVLFAFQIYCDFSGYSVIAMGASKVLGIDLMENFKAPYLSTSVAAFWRNWHISLTSWFKDYLYIPLGGSRKGKIRKYLNKIIVFLVSGLWHGANLTFVVWGGLNGLYQVIGEVLDPLKDKVSTWMHVDRKSAVMGFIRGLITFVLVDFTWIFFRAETLGDAKAIITAIGTDFSGSSLMDGTILNCGLDLGNILILGMALIVLFISDILKKKKIVIREKVLASNLWIQDVVFVAVICFLLVFGIWGVGYDASNFIYFQF